MSLPVTKHNPNIHPKEENKFENNYAKILKNVVNTYNSNTDLQNTENTKGINQEILKHIENFYAKQPSDKN